MFTKAPEHHRNSLDLSDPKASWEGIFTSQWLSAFDFGGSGGPRLEPSWLFLAFWEAQKEEQNLRGFLRGFFRLKPRCIERPHRREVDSNTHWFIHNHIVNTLSNKI